MYCRTLPDLTFSVIESDLGARLNNSLLKNYKPSSNLRSVDQGLLTVPRSNQRTYGDRAFSVAAPKPWNALPLDIRNSRSITLFKCKLKIFLFKKYYL